MDDDREQCRDAAFTDIQSAIDAVPVGATILVCAGTYAAPSVHKTVRLLGAQHGQDARTRAVPPSAEAVVVASASAFVVDANDVVVDGFSIQPSSGFPFSAIDLTTSVAHSGYQIMNTIFDTHLGIGILPDSSGASQIVIHHNRFVGAPDCECSGIWDDTNDGGGVMRNERIEHNLFDATSVTVIGSGSGEEHANLVIWHNDFINGGGLGVIGGVGSIQNVRITGNHVETGGMFVRQVDDLTLDYNHFTNGLDTCLVINGSNHRAFIDSNEVSGCGNSGILLSASGDVTVTGNTIRKNQGSGIQLTRTTGATISSNDVTGNGSGIDVDAMSGGNVLESNQVSGATPFDCQDLSTGFGTLGTADTWVGNTGNTSDPAGLCSPNP